MANSINFEQLEPFKNELIAFKLEMLNNVVTYYTESFLPELKEYTGTSQSEALRRAEAEKENFLRDVRTKTPLKYLDISKSEILDFLRRGAIEERERAIDHDYNIYIVMRSLRKAVIYINVLKQIEPKLEMYATKYLCKRNTITIN